VCSNGAGGPVATGVAKHRVFHFHRISILNFLNLNLFSAFYLIALLSNGIAVLLSNDIAVLLYYYLLSPLSSILQLPTLNYVSRVYSFAAVL
jgi:hypothetical protein